MSLGAECEAAGWSGVRTGRTLPRRVRGWAATVAVLLVAVGAGGGGCRRTPPPDPEDALLVTQVPVDGRGMTGSADVLDHCYPAGSRVVYVPRPGVPEGIVVLSAGLHSAGGPAVGPNGRDVLFAGKARPGATWQIYRALLSGGEPRAVTDLPEGAMEPAWLPEGRMVFASPVPRAGEIAGKAIPALYSMSVTGGVPVRLTHGLAPATDPTVLSDGRILFLSTVPGPTGTVGSALSLFTINSDGTEISAYAGQHDGAVSVRRPRESPDGRILFVSGGAGSTLVDGRIEQVLTARPFRSRSVVFPPIGAPCRSVEPAGEGAVLATLRETGPDRALASFAVYRLASGATRMGTPVFDDPAWDEVEAVSPFHSPRPMGRLSSVEPDLQDGVLLCMDANLTDRRGRLAAGAGAGAGAGAPAGTGNGMEAGVRVRFQGFGGEDRVERFGEVPLLADGSFAVRVPADLPLSIEVLDGAGEVIRRCPPTVWVRPGENRACVGCHEPHNRAPDNRRPLAVRQAPVRLRPEGRRVARLLFREAVGER